MAKKRNKQSFEKRRKEEKQKRKQEEKRQIRFNRNKMPVEIPTQPEAETTVPTAQTVPIVPLDESIPIKLPPNRIKVEGS